MSYKKLVIPQRIQEFDDEMLVPLDRNFSEIQRHMQITQGRMDSTESNITTLDGNITTLNGNITTHIAETTLADDVHDSKTYTDTQRDTRVAKAGDTMSGELNMADNLLTRPTIKDYGETAVIEIDITGAKTIDISTANYHRHTYTGDVTYTFSNPPASGTAGSFTLVAVQGATLRALTFPGSVSWAWGAAPVMVINKKYFMTFVTDDGGTSWTGFLAGEV